VYKGIYNKCIGDDTKAAARQSPNCIANHRNKIWRKTIFNMADEIITLCNVARSWHWFRQVTAPCNVACGSGIITVNSPSGSTLQCDTWLWDHDIEFARWQHPAMWQVALGLHAMEFAQASAILEFYIWFWFWPYHRSQHVILGQSLKFYPNRTTLGRKNDVMSILKDGGSQPSCILRVQ